MEPWLQRLLRWGRRGRALRQRRRHSLQRCVRLIWFGLVVTMLVVEMVAVVVAAAAAVVVMVVVVVVTFKMKMLPLTMIIEGACGDE